MKREAKVTSKGRVTVPRNIRRRPGVHRGTRRSLKTMPTGCDGFLGGVFAEFYLPVFGRSDFPGGFHLFAAIGSLHQLVFEGVAGLFSLAAQRMVSVA